MNQRKVNGVTVECIQGDIIDQPDMDAIVNAANKDLRIGGGVAGAIHKAAGAGLEEECRPYAPINPGQAVITGAHKLPNRHVIHSLGPVYGVDEPSDEILASTYRNALQLADENELTSIAFPAISTGAFGYPKELAAQIAVKTVVTEAESLKSIKHVRFVLNSESEHKLHEQILEQQAEPGSVL